MSFYGTYPPGGGSGSSSVPTYANLASLPSAVTAGDGALAIALDTNILYESDGAAWVAIAGPSTVFPTFTASRAVVTGVGGALEAATTTATEIGYVNGVTSAIQTQLNAKQATGNYITALTGDVTATGPGSAAATLATVTVGKGGTGITSGTSGGVPYYSGTSTIASSGALTASRVVLGGGAGAAPTSLAFGTANQVLGMNSGATAYEHKTMAVGTTGTDFAVAFAANSITFNLPSASAANRGAVTTGTQTFAGAKTFSSTPVVPGVTFSASGAICPGTADASDNQDISLCGGGGTSSTRGSTIQVFGNEVAAFGGRIYYAAGNTATALTTNVAHVFQAGAGTVVAQTTGAGSWTLGVRNAASYPGNAIAGCTDASNATAGDVGEYVEATQTTATNFAVTSQYTDIGSVALTAGDWDIEVAANANLNGATMTQWEFGVGTTTGNSGAGLAYGTTALQVLPPTTACQSGSSITVRKSISSTTTYYGKVLATYSAGNPQYRGMIRARRVR